MTILQGHVNDLLEKECEVRIRVNAITDMIVAIQADFLAHDHGTTYGETSLRINTTQDTIEGDAVSTTEIPLDLEVCLTPSVVEGDLPTLPIPSA